MESYKYPLRKTLTAGGILGLIFIIAFFSLKHDKLSELGKKDEIVSRSSLPIKLKIPSISVDATVEYVGITKLGAMEVPTDIKDVAWYKFGPTPGEIGSAVIAGHYGWKDGKPSAFDNLHNIKVGDKISVENQNKETITFVVREIKLYNPKANTKEIFSSIDGKAHLNLITCDGSWNKITQNYSSRLIIFTDRE